MVFKTVERGRGEAFFRSLADASLLRLLGALVGREQRIDDVAAQLEMRSDLITRHLERLATLGLVTTRSDGATTLFQLDLSAVRRMCRETFASEPGPTFGADVSVEDWEPGVLRNFFVDERLKDIPVVPKKRLAVLKWLAGRFNPGQRYPESEVNGILQRHHPDCAALRRYLVDEGFLTRDHGVYWRIEDGRRREFSSQNPE